MSQYLPYTETDRNTFSHVPSRFASETPSLAAMRLMRLYSISPEVAELFARLAGLGNREEVN